MGIIYGIEKLPSRKEKYLVIDDHISDDCDACIIGSGAAGGVLAKGIC
jgi:hypothetical protein